MTTFRFCVNASAMRELAESVLIAAENTVFFLLQLVFAAAVLALAALALSVLFWLFGLVFV